MIEHCKDYKIEIYSDESINESPNEWSDEIQLSFNHRQFNPQYKLNEDYEYVKYNVTAYIHSGIVLYLTKKTGWDYSSGGILYIKKGLVVSPESIINEWNMYLSGEVLAYTIYKKNVRYSISKDTYDRLVFEDNLGMIGDYFTEEIYWNEEYSSGGYYIKEEELLQQIKDEINES